MAYHQLNDWREIGCRLTYLLRLLGHVAAILLVTCGVTQWDRTLLLAASLACVAVLLLRRVGQCHFDFARMRESFPFGCPTDQVSPRRRTEVTGLIREFGSPDTDWTRRQEIRNRIISLTEEDPRAVRAYYDDLNHILPGLVKPAD
ncbi:MAG: hypothetical protein IIA65_08670 [Planctomycetes bacterium]|nr:hypothetical protein [Planctomycetota bacterium]